MTTELARTLVTLGGLFLLGLTTDFLSRRLPLPRVTLLLLAGFLLGPSVLRVIPDRHASWFPVIAEMGLVMVGFLLGNYLKASTLRGMARGALSVTGGLVTVTVVLVLGGSLVAGAPLPGALMLAAIATATGPRSITDVVHAVGARGPFSERLLAIVAIDEVIALILFGIALALAGAVGGEAGPGQAALDGLRQVIGALGVGAVLGLPMAYLTGRIAPGEPTLAEALGMVTLCGGVALWVGVSPLLAALALGTVVANLGHHHRRPFHAIEGAQWPFMILFFLLAGASLDISSLGDVGLIGGAYVGLRTVGYLAGGTLGGRVGGLPGMDGLWDGFALLPHAGVAIGMALVATQIGPSSEDAALVLTVVAGTTILFEVAGPILVRAALSRAGEVPAR